MDHDKINLDYRKKPRLFLIYSNKNIVDTADKQSCSSLSNFKKGKWNIEEDNLLIKAVNTWGITNWNLISKAVNGRNLVQCLHRWTKVLQPGLKKGPWTIEEDGKLIKWVNQHGACKWTMCSLSIKGRSGKQCRERWINSVNPNVKKGEWEPEEDYLIFKLYTIFGTRWCKISTYFLNRTENSIKNRFYSTLRRIAAEESSYNERQTNKHSKAKLNFLLLFILDAMKEKTLKLINMNDPNLSDNQNIIFNQHPDLLKINKTEVRSDNIQIIIDKNDKTSSLPILSDEYSPFDDQKFFEIENVTSEIDQLFENSVNNEKNCKLNFFQEERESEETCINFYNDIRNEKTKTNMITEMNSLKKILLYNKKSNTIE